jgi:hypothetical protein
VAGKDVTPWEAWTGEKPDLRHLRVIRSRGLALLPSARRKKMQEKARPCRLLGYQGSQNYILLGDDDKVFILNNVIFDETSTKKRKSEEDRNSIRNVQPRYKLNLPESSGDIHAIEDRQARPPEQSSTSSNSIQATTTQYETSSHTMSEGDTSTSHHSTPQDEEVIHDSITVAPPFQLTRQDNVRVDTHNVPHAATQHHPELTVPQTSTHQTSRFGLVARSPSPDDRFLLVSLMTPYALSANDLEPKTYRQATKSGKWDEWKKAMEDEMMSIHDNGTWRLAHPPQNVSPLRGKWVFKIKRGADGQIVRYKGRFVVRGFEQREGIDYHETFASVVKPMSYKAIFAIAAAMDYHIEQMDVKTAFLYGKIDEDIWVQQPEGFNDDSGRAYKLNKALYGLKQSPRIWYQTLSDYLTKLGFQPVHADVGIFVKDLTYIAVYVDDLLIVGPNMDEITTVKKQLSERFQMSDLGPCYHYLGITIKRDRARRRLYLSQKTYIKKILHDLGMKECHAVKTPVSPDTKFQTAPLEYTASDDNKRWYARAIGSLMYAMLGTRPDIAYAVSLLSRYLKNPTEEHITGVKRVLRYLKGTEDYVLMFEGQLKDLSGYCDADWGADPDTRRSTMGYVFNLGSGVISWCSKRQTTVALSTCEAELMAQTHAAKEAMWLRKLLQDLIVKSEEHTDLTSTIIFGDNQGAIALTKNPQHHGRTKHIAIREHYCRELAEAGDVKFAYIPTYEQVADGLTKGLSVPKFEAFRQALGVVIDPGM